MTTVRVLDARFEATPPLAARVSLEGRFSIIFDCSKLTPGLTSTLPCVLKTRKSVPGISFRELVRHCQVRFAGLVLLKGGSWSFLL